MSTSLSTPAKKIIYMTLFKAGQEVLDRHNPCQIKDGECAAGKGALEACCRGCKHLTPTGCSVNALTCKIYLCQTLLRKSGPGVKEANEAFRALFSVANKSGLMNSPYTNIRRSFEEIFHD